MNMLLTLAVDFALLCFVLAMGCAAWRMVRGPGAKNRILALDALYISGMLTVLTLGVRSAAPVYFDIALLIALFGFVGTCAMAKFLLRGEVIEP